MILGIIHIFYFSSPKGVVDFVKAGYHMRRAWKMYEKCHREIHGCDPEVSTKKSPKRDKVCLFFYC